MRPPCCPLCGLSLDTLADQDRDRRLSELFELVRFRDYRPLPDGQSGHPEGEEWFCLGHAPQAQRLSHLDLERALEQLTSRR